MLLFPEIVGVPFVQMRCDICNGPAAIHIQEVINGQQKSLNLCQDCANEQNITPESLDSGSIAAFLGKFEQLVKPEPQEPAHDWPELCCPACGMTSARFREGGRLGCPTCFQSFASILEQILPSMHKDTQHLGRSPAACANTAGDATAVLQRRRREIELRQQLKEAIEAEHYEKAAALRDALSALEQEVGA
jgi:protein arginine kinase activator